MVIVTALQEELNGRRNPEAIDQYLDTISQIIFESESEVEHFIRAGIVETLIHLLRTRAVDGVGLDIVLRLLGLFA